MKTRRSFLACILASSLLLVAFKSGDVNLTNPTNIYLYREKLLVSDSKNGIFIYSVSDPSSPKFQMRIPIQGNSGMAMREDILYANSYTTLLALRLHQDTLYDVVKVVAGPPQWEGHEYMMHEGGHVGCGCGVYDVMPTQDGAVSGGGIGGSYATFAVIDSFLYYLDRQYEVVTMDISTPDNPRELGRTHVDWSIETLFPTHDYLYVGGRTGMYILDRKNPAKPVKVGTLTHFRSCDPVVVRDTLAFVTLRGGSMCGGNQNVLLSVNISDPRNPKTIDQENLQEPWGLAVSGSLIYVAQGGSGLSLYSAEDPSDLRLVKSFQQPQSKDFIWQDNKLYVMGVDRIEIHDVTDPRNPIQLGTVR